MTETTMTLEDMYNDLLTNYSEMYHEDQDLHDPDGYQEYLDGLSDDELTEEYDKYYGDY